MLARGQDFKKLVIDNLIFGKRTVVVQWKENFRNSTGSRVLFLNEEEDGKKRCQRTGKGKHPLPNS